MHSVVSNHLFLINTQELAFFYFSGCRDDDEKKKSVSDLNNKESLSCDVLKGVAVQPNEAGLVGSHDTRNRAIASWPLSAWLNYWPPPLLRIPRIAQHILLPCMLLDLIAAYLFLLAFLLYLRQSDNLSDSSKTSNSLVCILFLLRFFLFTSSVISTQINNTKLFDFRVSIFDFSP